MEYFSDDCSFDFPRGPESWGQRYTGKAQVREANGKIKRKDSFWKIVEQ
jgi:hypothetical protein